MASRYEGMQACSDWTPNVEQLHQADISQKANGIVNLAFIIGAKLAPRMTNEAVIKMTKLQIPYAAAKDCR